MSDRESSEILLRVPARAPYARIVRVGAAALGLRQGMGFAEIDDLRLVIDEAMTVLLDGLADDVDADIEIVFRLADRRLELEAHRQADGTIPATAVDRFDAAAAGLVDDYDLDADHAWLRIRTSAAPAEPDPADL